jgi:hypothetical protein
MDCPNGCRIAPDADGVLWLARQCNAHDAESLHHEVQLRQAYDYELDVRLSEMFRGRRLELPIGALSRFPKTRRSP